MLRRINVVHISGLHRHVPHVWDYNGPILCHVGTVQSTMTYVNNQATNFVVANFCIPYAAKFRKQFSQIDHLCEYFGCEHVIMHV